MDASFSAFFGSMVLVPPSPTWSRGGDDAKAPVKQAPRRTRAEPRASKRDLLVLRAMATYPWATDSELGRALGLPRNSVTRARSRLRDRGVFRGAYALDLDRVHPGPVAVVCGRGGPGVSDRDLARGLERLLKESQFSGAFIVEGGSFAGALTSWPDGHLPLWSGAALSRRAPHAGGYLIHSIESFPFPQSEVVRRSPVDFRPFLETVTGNGRLPGAAPHPKVNALADHRPLRRNEVAVARSLLQAPDAPIAEAAREVGLSRSTFAHVKGTLLARGYVRETGFLDLPALGYPVLLVVALYRRPQRDDRPHDEPLDFLARGTAPVTVYASPAHQVTVTPFSDLMTARNAVRELAAREQALELLAPPFAAPFVLPQAHQIAHAEPTDLMAAWLRSEP